VNDDLNPRRDCGRGGFDCGFGGRSETSSSSSRTKLVCQLCKKIGHAVLQSWKCFDRNYTGEERVANNTEGNGYNVDAAWYSDTGATNHITSELDKLTMHEKYTGQEQIHVANGEVCKLLTLENLHFIPLII
jgi:hypothetical protein